MSMSVRILAAVLISHAAIAQGQSYATTLAGPNENPPNASPGSGTARVTVNLVLNTMSIEASFSGLVGNTQAAHIHCCIAPPGNIGVATTTPTFPGFPLGVTSGTYSQVFDLTQPSTFNGAFVTSNGGTAQGAAAALTTGIANGQAYFNVHTSAFGGGEIRGFLRRELLVDGFEG